MLLLLSLIVIIFVNQISTTMTEIFGLYSSYVMRRPFLTKLPSIWKMTFHFSFTHSFTPNSASVMQRFSLICHNVNPNPFPNQSNFLLPFQNPHSLSLSGRFDEDGSWIGQYGTLRRKHQQRVSAESGLPPGATYVWWSSWSSSWSWWWSCRGPWWWTRPGKTLERKYLGRIKSRSCQVSAIYVWISTQSENRNLFLPQSEEIPCTQRQEISSTK